VARKRKGMLENFIHQNELNWIVAKRKSFARFKFDSCTGMTIVSPSVPLLGILCKGVPLM
jgi:hypothetical protein